MENNSQKPDIEIRTMKSDIEAMKAGGGDATGTQFVKLAEDKIPKTPEEIKISIKAPGYAGEEKGIFSASGEIKAVQAASSKIPFKTIAIVLISILAVAGLGYLAYNVALKLL
ncbi:MAG: hypothetical protein M1170_02850 [Patescibacteria group bacterium]|nr:hypothetical protein [Patescibacteria group bacterium]